MKIKSFLIASALFTSAMVQAQTVKVFNTQPLTLTVITGSEAGMGVNSVIVAGKTDAILIDAQFTKTNAQKVIEALKASGKTLKQIYISYEDPDYYFGLEWIKSVYPNVLVTAKPAIIDHIIKTEQAKLEVWGGIFKDEAPRNVVLPQVQKSDTLWVENTPLIIKNATETAKKGTFIWIPSSKTVLGGISVMSGTHVFTADDQTKVKRENWIKSLNNISNLKPVIVIPGHMDVNGAFDISAVSFTQQYLKDFEIELAKHKNSKDLISAMEAKYPNLSGKESLNLSAKVNTGEMKW